MDKSCSNANTRYCTGERSERETVGKSGKNSVCVCVCRDDDTKGMTTSEK